MFYLVRLASALVIAFAYMLFDIFNRRNIPDVFAYSTLAYALVLGLFAGTATVVEESLLVAAIIIGAGYLVYKMGELGAGDVIELAAISLLLFAPVAPLLSIGIPQLGLPFVVSLLLDIGLVAVLFVPLYYIPRAAHRFGAKTLRQVSQRDIIKAVTITAAYAIFLVFLVYYAHIDVYGTAVVLAVMVGSALLVLFQKPITATMVDVVGVDQFEEGDILAFNMMSRARITREKRRIGSFDRLVTRRLIREMKSKKVKDKFPVYKRAVPLALPIFVALVLSVLYGNLILLVLFR
jgi:Flp pilus assembly protein protease CpaA